MTGAKNKKREKKQKIKDQLQSNDLFIDTMTVYAENFKSIYKKATRISELKKIIGYKVNVQNSIVFMY